jgi:hypothetical protein
MFRKGIGTAYLSAFFLAVFSGHAFAALPFTTDDAGTVSKGETQVELWYAGSTDEETVSGSKVKTEENLPGATLGHGVAETVDLTFAFARVWGDTTVDGVSSSDVGTADFAVNMKWRFYEKSGLAFAVKPLVGYSYLVGGANDEDATSYGGWLIATKEIGAAAISLNAGYFYHDYNSAAERDASRSSIWSVSALATYRVHAGWKLGLDVGTATNPDKSDSEMPAYALGGAIYSPNSNVELSLGMKFGITRPEPDYAGIAGITFRF